MTSLLLLNLYYFFLPLKLRTEKRSRCLSQAVDKKTEQKHHIGYYSVLRVAQA